MYIIVYTGYEYVLNTPKYRGIGLHSQCYHPISIAGQVQEKYVPEYRYLESILSSDEMILQYLRSGIVFITKQREDIFSLFDSLYMIKYTPEPMKIKNIYMFHDEDIGIYSMI